jgi:hypothetical protein
MSLSASNMFVFIENCFFAFINAFSYTTMPGNVCYSMKQFFFYQHESTENSQGGGPSTSDPAETFRVGKAHLSDNYFIRVKVMRTQFFSSYNRTAFFRK